MGGSRARHVVLALIAVLAGAGAAHAAVAPSPSSGSACPAPNDTNHLVADATKPGVIDLLFFNAKGARVSFYECVGERLERIAARRVPADTAADDAGRRHDVVLRPARTELRRVRHAARRHARVRHLQRAHRVVCQPLPAQRPAPRATRLPAARARRRPLGDRRDPAAALRHAAGRPPDLPHARLPGRCDDRQPPLSHERARALARRAARARSARTDGLGRRRRRGRRPARAAAGRARDGRLDDAGHRQLPRRRARRRRHRPQRRAAGQRHQPRRLLAAARGVADQAPAPARDGHVDRRRHRRATDSGRHRRSTAVLRRGLDERLCAPRAPRHAVLPARRPRPRRLAHATRAALRAARGDHRMPSTWRSSAPRRTCAP